MAVILSVSSCCCKWALVFLCSLSWALRTQLISSACYFLHYPTHSFWGSVLGIHHCRSYGVLWLHVPGRWWLVFLIGFLSTITGCLVCSLSVFPHLIFLLCDVEHPLSVVVGFECCSDMCCFFHFIFVCGYKLVCSGHHYSDH